MLGASPGKTSDTRNPQHNHGLGSTLKACYSEIHFEVTAEESVRYVSSVRALNGTSSAIISITDTFCDITDITAEPTSPGNAYYPVYMVTDMGFSLTPKICRYRSSIRQLPTRFMLGEAGSLSPILIIR